MANTLSGSNVLNADVEIGAVEIKNATDDTRATVGSKGLNVDIQGSATIISTSFTRPSDTTLYTANDVASDSTSAPTNLTFDAIARANAGTGIITDVVMIDSANQATSGAFELWLFDTNPTVMEDNAAFDPTDAECANVVAIIPLATSYQGTATAGAGGNRVYQTDSINRVFKCATSDDALYGVLVVRNGYTPVSAEIFTIELHILQD